MRRVAVSLLAVLTLCLVAWADFGPAQGGASGGGASLPTPGAQGSLLVSDSDPAYVELAIGANDTVVSSDGTDTNYETLTSLMDSAFGGTQGMVLFRGAAGYEALGVGTVGQVLHSGGAAADVSWDTDDMSGFSLVASPWEFTPAPADAVIPQKLTLTSGKRVLGFDGGTDEDMYWWGVIPATYVAGSNLTVKLHWSANGTSQDMEWELAFATTQAEDHDGAASGWLDTPNDSGSITSSGTAGVVTTHTYTLANGLCDGMAAGDNILLHLNRDASADASAVEGYVHSLVLSQ